MKSNTSYVNKGINYYENNYKERIIKNLKKIAQEMGY